MTKKTATYVLTMKGSFVEVKSWSDLRRLERAGEIDALSTVVSGDWSSCVGKLDDDFFGGDAATVATRVLAGVAVFLVLALAVAFVVKSSSPSAPKADAESEVAAEDASEPFDAESEVAAEDASEPFGAESEVAAEDASEPFDAEPEVAAEDASEPKADAEPEVAAEDASEPFGAEPDDAERLVVEPVFDDAERKVFRDVVDNEAGLKREFDEKNDPERLPFPLRRRTAYPGLAEREVGILLTPEFEASYARAIAKTPFSFFEFVSSEKREADFNVWGGTFATNPYAHGERLPGPSPHVLPNATQPFDLFYYDARLKREYIGKKKDAYVAEEKRRIKEEAAERGEFPRDDEIEVETPEDKDVVAVERWESINALYDDMREAAALLDAEKFDEGRERLDRAQERLSFSSKALRTHVRVKAVFSAFYYYLKAIEIKRLVVAGEIERAEAEFVNLTNGEFFKEQFVGFQLGVYKDFAGLLAKCGHVDRSVVYLEYLREYCRYVYHSEEATTDDRRKADVVAASLAWDLIYIYERQGNHKSVAEIGEPLWQAHINGRSAPASNALFDYDVKEMRKHLAIAYWNIGNKATATRIFEDYLKERQNDVKNAPIREFWNDLFVNEASDWREASRRARQIYSKIAADESDVRTENVDFEFAFCRTVAQIKRALYWGDREQASAALGELCELTNSSSQYQVHIAWELCELGAALYSYGCWEDAEYCYSKAWLINAAYFNDPSSLLNLRALLGIASARQAMGRDAEALEFLGRGLDPMLDQLVALRAKTLDSRELSAKLGEEIGELAEKRGQNKAENAETDEEFVWGLFWHFGGRVGAGKMREAQRDVEEARKTNTSQHWLKNLADDCRELEQWGPALLLYRHWQTRGDLPGAEPSELANVRAQVEARIAECETKLKAETM